MRASIKAVSSPRSTADDEDSPHRRGSADRRVCLRMDSSGVRL